MSDPWQEKLNATPVPTGMSRRTFNAQLVLDVKNDWLADKDHLDWIADGVAALLTTASEEDEPWTYRDLTLTAVPPSSRTQRTALTEAGRQALEGIGIILCDPTATYNELLEAAYTAAGFFDADLEVPALREEALNDELEKLEEYLERRDAACKDVLFGFDYDKYSFVARRFAVERLRDELQTIREKVQSLQKLLRPEAS